MTVKKPHLSVPAGAEAFARLRKVQAAHGGNLHKIGLRYALERFLFRIFHDDGAGGARLFLNPENDVVLATDTITLKGGMTMTFAEDVPPLQGRSTGDADLHLAGFPGSMSDYAAILRRVLAGPPPSGPDDGVRFDVDAVELRRDREERTGGTVTIPLQIGSLWLQVKTDVSCDARPMHDRAPVVEYPSVVPDSGLPPPVVRRVPYEFMLADKVIAAVEYGEANIRIRDYHDVRLILGKRLVDEGFLARTLAATARFKGLDLPATMDDAPGFSDAFAQAKSRRYAEERKAKNYQVPGEFPEIVAWLRENLEPVLQAAHAVSEMPDWAAAPR